MNDIRRLSEASACDVFEAAVPAQLCDSLLLRCK
jgi:hypothetical protein